MFFVYIWIYFFALILRYTVNLMTMFWGKKKEEEKIKFNVCFNCEII